MTSENIKEYIKKNYTPSEYKKTLLYIEPENFDISKVTPIIKESNKWTAIEFLYEYSTDVKGKLNFKTNFSELACTISYNKFKNFLLNINSQENNSLQNQLHKLDSLIFEEKGRNSGIASYMSNFFTSELDHTNNIYMKTNSNHHIKCKPALKNNISDSKVIFYNSWTKIKKELEKGNQIQLYDEYTDLFSNQFTKLLKNISKKDKYGGYQARYILSPMILIGPKPYPSKMNGMYPRYISYLISHQIEIRHSKSNIKSVIDKDEVTMISEKSLTVQI